MDEHVLPYDTVGPFIKRTKSYWIDGYFDVFWNQPNVWFCVKRGVFIPKFATVRKTVSRIYITEQFAKRILKRKKFDSTNKYDMFDMSLKNKINVPWVREVYSGPPVALP